ncbi:MAG: hypothetical protein JJ908_10900 [Rhizobiales bacterium]|nr:hypothetical protein [Hyphomicrobiales bacterium]MBO6699329.1 hypothetical protein [Hyphomicrobiales bacterium]MBO6736867.1 hypothetical protein [Hyphomicrobiales bacterium]MBO6912059.1 hypothetical protein [Hyphomicrobiales bacterium]MBO6954573.1 hypothetical protein [Hyphomicrobiales bacterium]
MSLATTLNVQARLTFLGGLAIHEDVARKGLALDGAEVCLLRDRLNLTSAFAQGANRTEQDGTELRLTSIAGDGHSRRHDPQAASLFWYLHIDGLMAKGSRDVEITPQALAVRRMYQPGSAISLAATI